MGNHSNDCTPYHANRCPGSGYNANRTRSCDSVRDNEPGEYSRSRRDADCGSYYPNARCEKEESACREDSCSPYSSDSGYVWRGSDCTDSQKESYSRCPARLHLHEVQGSVQIVSDGCCAHTHRFVCVTSEPILLNNGKHIHRLTFRTDSCNGHFHEFTGATAPDCELCDGHVHYCAGQTDECAGHCHKFRLVTHIENPAEDR